MLGLQRKGIVSVTVTTTLLPSPRSAKSTKSCESCSTGVPVPSPWLFFVGDTGGWVWSLNVELRQSRLGSPPAVCGVNALQEQTHLSTASWLALTAGLMRDRSTSRNTVSRNGVHSVLWSTVGVQMGRSEQV